MMSGTKVIVFDLTPFVDLSKRHILSKRYIDGEHEDSNLWLCLGGDKRLKDYIALALTARDLGESIAEFIEDASVCELLASNPLDDLLIELEEFACLIFTWASKLQSDLEPLAIVTNHHHNGRLIITQRGS
jgi:hypothetical protein